MKYRIETLAYTPEEHAEIGDIWEPRGTFETQENPLDIELEWSLNWCLALPGEELADTRFASITEWQEESDGTIFGIVRGAMFCRFSLIDK